MFLYFLSLVLLGSCRSLSLEVEEDGRREGEWESGAFKRLRWVRGIYEMDLASNVWLDLSGLGRRVYLHFRQKIFASAHLTWKYVTDLD